MGMHGFLGGKSWHTQSRKNRTLVEEASRAAEERKSRRSAQEKELEREAEALACAKDGRAELAFMYVAPTNPAPPSERKGSHGRREREASREPKVFGRSSDWEDPLRALSSGADLPSPVGGGNPNDENQRLLVPSGGEDIVQRNKLLSAEAFRELSRREQRRLLRSYRKRARVEDIDRGEESFHVRKKRR